MSLHSLYADYLMVKRGSPWISAEEQAVLTQYPGFHDRIPEEDVPALIDLLGHPQGKWFVAKLLTAAATAPDSLFAPLIEAGLTVYDPSFSRYFVFPSLRIFGLRRTIDRILDYIREGPLEQRIGACGLLSYVNAAPFAWIESQRMYDVDVRTIRAEHPQELHDGILVITIPLPEDIRRDCSTVLEQVLSEDDNIVLRYFISLQMPNYSNNDIPTHADELIDRISGDRHLEHLLFDVIGWRRP